ncbi:hypothetical protein AX14_006591, partial [Amanita brunnescens Koide BX004]
MKSPGIVKVTLFADNTTIYFAEDDDMQTLNSVLKHWCTASGAKFNPEKTVVLPVGNDAYRASLYDTRRTSLNAEPLPANVRIAGDGEPVRILGCFIGNNVEQMAMWTPVIDKIEASLDQWNKSHPTVNGRHLILNMVVGGCTQHLTSVQGMPPHIEKRLSALMLKFTWDHKAYHPVSSATLHEPPSRGGIKLLNLRARNEAIELIKLKSYLNFDNRPLWAFLTDDLFSQNAVSVSSLAPDSVRLNPFLQRWHPRTMGKYCTLPGSLIRMYRTACKYNLSFSPVAISCNVKLGLPLWAHLGLPPKAYPKSTKAVKCLREVHRLGTVTDALNLASTPLPPGCYDPSECWLNAGQLFLQLPPFWNPLLPGPDESTPGEPLNPPTPPVPDSGTVYFDPCVTVASVTEAFRVCLPTPVPPRATQPSRPLLDTPSPPTISVYTDGSSQLSARQDRIAGSGVWYGHDDPRNKLVRLPPFLPQTNNAAELAAILVAVQDAPPTRRIQVLSDSKYSLDALTKNLKRAEDSGFLYVANSPLLLKGHAGIAGNEGADSLASIAANPTHPVHELDVAPRAGLIADGIKLAMATQALLYQSILTRGGTLTRRAAALNLALTQETNKTRLGLTPTPAQVWQSLADKVVSRPARVFLWKCLHGAHRVSQYWSHIPELGQRAECHICNTEESMSHILTECPASGQQHVWALARDMLLKKGITLPPLTLGLVMGCAIKASPMPQPAAAAGNAPRHLSAGAQRLYTLVSGKRLRRMRCS